MTLEIHPLRIANEKSPRDTEIQQTLLPDLCEACWGRSSKAFMQPWRLYACQAPQGPAWGWGVTLGSLVMCATSKRIRLCPPPLISDPYCGLQGECVEVMRPWSSTPPPPLTTTGALGMSVRQAVRKRKSETGGKQCERERERPGSPPNQLKWKLSL